MDDRPTAATRPWQLRQQLTTGALTGLALIGSLAVPWPLALAIPAALVCCLLLLARSRRLSNQLLLAGFVAGILFMLVSGLVSNVLTGQPLLPTALLVCLELSVAALGVLSIVTPVGHR